MSGSPYVRPNLAATKAGIPDPGLEVDCWLDRLRDVLAGSPETALEWYDLLASWAKIRRCRQELVDRHQGAAEMEEAERVIQAAGPEGARDALTVPNVPAWLEETKELEAAFEGGGPHELRSTLAERLLTDLDDADLALCAARRLGVEDQELEDGLARCHEWLAQNASLFLPASVHVQAVGMALRPDLEEFDYGLAATALKYVDLLRAAEVAEQELTWGNVSAWSPQAVNRLVERYQLERDRRQAEVTLFLLWAARRRAACRKHSPVARAGEEAAVEAPRFWEWTSPSGEFTARLVIPGAADVEEQAVLEFVGAEMRRATSLAGQPVWLHGVAGLIDAQGKATFAVSALLETEEPLVLRVGHERTEWMLRVHTADG